jgi:hypothetical protein
MMRSTRIRKSRSAVVSAVLPSSSSRGGFLENRHGKEREVRGGFLVNFAATVRSEMKGQKSICAFVHLSWLVHTIRCPRKKDSWRRVFLAVYMQPWPRERACKPC